MPPVQAEPLVRLQLMAYHITGVIFLRPHTSGQRLERECLIGRRALRLTPSEHPEPWKGQGSHRRLPALALRTRLWGIARCPAGGADRFRGPYPIPGLFGE